MRAHRRRYRKRSIAEINVVPYIDVMLVLLVIFMVATPLLTQGVKVDLPSGKAETIDVKQNLPLVVTVNKQGEYFVSTDADTPLTAQQLAVRVAAELKLAEQKGQTKLVLVRGDEAVNYGKVVQAMILLKRAGVQKVGLMTEEPNSQ